MHKINERITVDYLVLDQNPSFSAKFTGEKLEDNYSGVTVHDFRIVNGETHTNVIFDIVVPFEYKHPEVITDDLKKTVNDYAPHLYAVINVDSKYS